MNRVPLGIGLFLLFTAGSVQALPATRHLPFISNETWWCSQDWYANFPPYTHLNEAAWDFNWGSGSSDLGKPIVAPASGRIEYAGNTGGGYGTVVLIRYPDNTFDRLAHLDGTVVRKGEPVEAGQVVGYCGTSATQAVHLHVNAQSSASPTASGGNSLESSFSYHQGSQDFVGRPLGCNCDYDAGPSYEYTSLNFGAFQREYDANGGANNFGSLEGSVHWWPGAWDADDRYRSGNIASRAYLQDYTGNYWYDCAISYDALGGARKAYTVRTGFWNNGQGNGWYQQSGPQGPYGMPITNEYTSAGGGTRQEFQKGYLVFENGQVTWSTYGSVGKVAPGWTSTGWNNLYSYLFARAYERNGGAVTVGLPSAAVYSYGPYLRQDFSGGTYGNCSILYDSDNAVGNASATNEAYLLRTGFYNYYQANGGQSAFGCPSRDEYNTGDPGDAIQFFVRRVGGVTQFHHMYYDASQPSGQQVTWHSSYATAYVSQSPAGQFNMPRGATRTFTVSFRNTGSTTWYNNPSAYFYDYAELKSCDAGGSVTASFLNDPFSTSLGWINFESPCTMQETSVPPNGVGTFTFTGRVAATAPLGLKLVYFRPNHSVGGLLQDWAGMHFQVNVVRKTVNDFDGDGISDVWDRTADGKFHLDYAVDNLDGWDYTYSGYGGSLDQPAPADYDGDGKCDFAVLWNADRTYRIDYAADGFGGFATPYYGGYGSSGDYPCPADYDGDGKADISVRDADGDWHIDYASNGFGAWDNTFLGYGGFNDRPAPADYDGDGKCDFAVLRNSDRKFLIDYSSVLYNGQPFGSWDVTNLGGYGGFADYPCPADYDGDGKADIAVLWTGDGTYRIDHSSNSFGGWAYILGGYGGTGDRAMPGDYDGDGRDDIGVYHAAVSRVCFDFWNYQGVTGWNGWDYCDTNHPPTAAPFPGARSAPLTFSVSPSRPNPFNPQTTIRYTLPSASRVTLQVFNVLGQRVATLVDAEQRAGPHEAVWDATGLASGVYHFRLTAGSHRASGRMVLLK